MQEFTVQTFICQQLRCGLITGKQNSNGYSMKEKQDVINMHAVAISTNNIQRICISRNGPILDQLIYTGSLRLLLCNWSVAMRCQPSSQKHIKYICNDRLIYEMRLAKNTNMKTIHSSVFKYSVDMHGLLWILLNCAYESRNIP